MSTPTKILLWLVAALVGVAAFGVWEIRRLLRYEPVDARLGVVWDREQRAFCSPQGCTRVHDAPNLRYSTWRDALGTDSAFERVTACIPPGMPAAYRNAGDRECPAGVIPASR